MERTKDAFCDSGTGLRKQKKLREEVPELSLLKPNPKGGQGYWGDRAIAFEALSRKYMIICSVR
jgi:hypothetical protein